VLDEVVGYLVTVAVFLTLRGPLGPTGFALAFVLFRVFDILKVQPARRLEELPGAYGIMLDDVAAGAYAGLVLVGASALGLHWERS
jgi:phosphatidylglycerophosphatase A